MMEQDKVQSSLQLILSILFLIMGLFLVASVVFYFAWGLPIGLFFISLSIWFFAMWKYNKKIPLRDSIWLFVLPVMGLYAIVRQMLNIPQTGFEGILFFVILGYILYSFFKKAKTQ